jgi:hypothetical protein
MQYVDKFFYLCEIPLGAENASDVEILTRAENNEDFPRVFQEFERLRAHASNKEGLYSVVRADVLHAIIRTSTPDSAREMAFEESRSEIITNLQHRVMQLNDLNAKELLKRVHHIDMDNLQIAVADN